jgi:hypothetical protein
MMSINTDFDPETLTRVRMEYLEMPDLRLTSSQACRLWNLDQRACNAILAALTQDHFLSQTGDGSYVIASSDRRFQSGKARPRHDD